MKVKIFDAADLGSNEIYATLHEKLVLGWMPNFVTEPIKPKANGYIFFGLKDTFYKYIKGVFISNIGGISGIFIAKNSSFNGKNKICFHFLVQSNQKFLKNCVQDPTDYLDIYDGKKTKKKFLIKN